MQNNEVVHKKSYIDELCEAMADKQIRFHPYDRLAFLVKNEYSNYYLNMNSNDLLNNYRNISWNSAISKVRKSL